MSQVSSHNHYAVGTLRIFSHFFFSSESYGGGGGLWWGGGVGGLWWGGGCGGGEDNLMKKSTKSTRKNIQNLEENGAVM